jgi:hypothetical protein
MTPEGPAVATAPARRTGAALVSAAIAGTAAICLGFFLAPPIGPRSSLTTIHGGTASYIVATTLAARSGCDSIELTVTDRDGRPVLLDDATVTGIMPLMGYTSVPASATGTGPSYLVENLCFSMPGPWELSLALASSAGTETLSVPVHIAG